MKNAIFTTALFVLLLMCSGVAKGQELLSNPPMDAYITCVSHPVADIVYVGGGEGLYKSSDNGDTWDMVFEYDTTMKPFLYLWFIDDSVGFATTGSNMKNVTKYDDNPQRVLYKTTDAGESWTVIDTAHYFWDIKFVSRDTLFAISLTQPIEEFPIGTLFKSVDGGASWVCIYDGNYEIWDYSVVPPSTIYAMKSYKYYEPNSQSQSPLVGTPVVLKSTDMGESWSIVFSEEDYPAKLPKTIDIVHFFTEGDGVLMGHYQIFTENDFETFEAVNSGYHVSDGNYGAELRLQAQYLGSGYSVVTSWDEYDVAGPSTIRLSKDKGHHYKIISLPQPDVCGVSGSDHDTTFFVVCPSVFTNQPSYIYRIKGSDFPPVGVEEYELGPNVTIAPNPVTGNCQIRSESPIKEMWVYDMLGRMLGYYEYAGTAGEVMIPASSWGCGTYFLKINTEKGLITKKIIKK